MSSLPHRKDAGTQSADREFLNQTTSLIIDKAIVVHSKLGPGLLESVYSTCLTHELRKAGATVVTEQIVPVFYDELQLDNGYRLDMLVNDAVIVEIKTVERILPVHEAQLISYLKLLDKRVGLLLNFKVPVLTQGIKRKNNF
jgi:GxxExxY protein